MVEYGNSKEEMEKAVLQHLAEKQIGYNFILFNSAVSERNKSLEYTETKGPPKINDTSPPLGPPAKFEHNLGLVALHLGMICWTDEKKSSKACLCLVTSWPPPDSARTNVHFYTLLAPQLYPVPSI